MSKKRRRRRKIRGTGVGRGHGGNTPNLPGIKERPLSAMERKWQAAGQLEPDLKGYSMGGCTISVGTSHLGHHLAIARRDRYPTWDEIARVRQALLPDELSFGLVFPPTAEYVNIHNNCFHLWQVEGLSEVRKLGTVAHDMAQALVEINAVVSGDDTYPDDIITKVQAAIETLNHAKTP